MRTFKCLDCGKGMRTVWFSPPKATMKDGDGPEVRAEIEATYAKEAGKPLCRGCWDNALAVGRPRQESGEEAGVMQRYRPALRSQLLHAKEQARRAERYPCLVGFAESVLFLFEKLEGDAQDHPVRIAEMSQEIVRELAANTRNALAAAREAAPEHGG